MNGDLGLLTNLSISLVLALVLGLITQKLRLSPIVGYLLAGIVIGPQTPGFVGDIKIASELAEIGVILLMFGVGLHFDIKDLLAVKRIALPGAIGQILIATMVGLLVSWIAGMGTVTGIIIGFSVSVASTVVVVRVLMDNDILHSTQGHIAVGWLIVQDIFTVLVLVVMPALADAVNEQPSVDQNIFFSLGSAVVKVISLGLIVVVGGRRVIPWLLRQVARTRSRELFTLTILAIALAIATGSAVLFGVSMALGAFLAGMVVGQTEMSHQAAADALPMRDAFAVLFFVSVGMLFDPQVILNRPGMLLAMLAIVLLANPIVAFVITWTMRYSFRTALTVAIALSQIGEFSFLLADEAMKTKLMPVEGQSLLVACAILTIAINPILFLGIVPFEKWLRSKPWLWRKLNERAEASGAELNKATHVALLGMEQSNESPESAVIIGYGPVGQTACRILREFGVRPVVIDLNLDTVKGLSESGKFGVYGDATRPDILEAAGIRKAKYLLVTVPEVLVRTVVILTAKDLNPELRVFARARYIQERAWLEEVGATGVVTEEAETALGLAVLLLREMHADEDRIEKEIRKIQEELHPRAESASEDTLPLGGSARGRGG
ncbi:MAG: cation:proton antiporter [Planctomycetota bacterium]|nr:cation:proton antiporter [Planctomycetota bacterium]